jgi:hypothetical protein
MATFNKFNAFVEHLAEGVHNLQSHTLKVMLTNTAPVATNSVRADLTEIAAGNGYTAGGADGGGAANYRFEGFHFSVGRCRGIGLRADLPHHQHGRAHH